MIPRGLLLELEDLEVVELETALAEVSASVAGGRKSMRPGLGRNKEVDNEIRVAASQLEYTV